MKLQKLQAIKAKTQKGFTLIELMITVAIVGILAAVALPAYQNYTIRAQAAEAVSLAGGLQTAVAEYYANNGTMPTSNDTAGTATAVQMASPTGKYVATEAVGAAGVITATFSNASPTNAKLQGGVVSLKPTADANGNISWTCGATADGTTVSKQYLPTSCQGN